MIIMFHYVYYVYYDYYGSIMGDHYRGNLMESISYLILLWNYGWSVGPSKIAYIKEHLTIYTLPPIIHNSNRVTI